MKYLPPFELVKAHMTITSVKGALTVSGTYEDFIQMVRQLISGVPVDEKWYLERYQDIAEAVQNGSVPSARLHFVDDGYFEGRMPFPILVDERYYLAQNPGVADGVRKGTLVSGQRHFDEHGYQEGRLPFGL